MPFGLYIYSLTDGNKGLSRPHEHRALNQFTALQCETKPPDINHKHSGFEANRPACAVVSQVNRGGTGGGGAWRNMRLYCCLETSDSR